MALWPPTPLNAPLYEDVGFLLVTGWWQCRPEMIRDRAAERLPHGPLDREDIYISADLMLLFLRRLPWERERERDGGGEHRIMYAGRAVMREVGEVVSD